MKSIHIATSKHKKTQFIKARAMLGTAGQCECEYIKLVNINLAKCKKIIERVNDAN